MKNLRHQNLLFDPVIRLAASKEDLRVNGNADKSNNVIASTTAVASHRVSMLQTLELPLCKMLPRERRFLQL